MIDVFLSYAHEDRDRVQPLIKALQSEGWKVWWDTDIEAGVQFDIEIETAMEHARCVVVLWSEHSIDSQWVRSEAHEGFDRKILVPALLDDVHPPLPFRLVQASNFFNPPISEHSDFGPIIQAIRHTLSGKHATGSDFGAAAQNPKRRPLFGIGPHPVLALVVVVAALLYLANSLWFQTDPVNPEPRQDVIVDFAPPENSIAVLPFLNMSEDSANDYFSDGISEEILNSLASLGNFKVTARSSSFSFRDQQLDIPTIGKRLNVARLLEGSVRKQGTKVRISAQLVDALDGSQIWASTYDRELVDIFAVQEDISRNIVKSLEIAMGGKEDALLARRYSSDFEAFDVYLLGRHFLHQRTVESIGKSIDLFQQSILREPGYVLAYTGLADAYNLLTAYGDLSGQEAAALMEPIVEKAIDLDPNLAEVQTSYGAMLGNLGLLEQEEEKYRLAIDINANYALAFMWLGNNLLLQGQLNDGIEIFEDALALDPMNPAVIINLARSAMYMGNIDQAVLYLQAAELVMPDSALVHEQRSWMLREFGRLDQSLEAALIAAELDPAGAQVLAGVTSSYLALGMLDEAANWTEQAGEQAPDNWHVIWSRSENMFLRGQFDQLDQFISQRFALEDANNGHSGPDLKTLYYWAGLAHLQLGRFRQAADSFDLAFSSDFEHQFEAQHELRFRGYRILAHQQAGEDSMAKLLLEEALDYIKTTESQGWKVPEFQFHTASIHELAGDRLTALEYLQSAIEGGFRYQLLLDQDPVMQSMQDDDEFQLLRGIITQDIERMKRLLGEP